MVSRLMRSVAVYFCNLGFLSAVFRLLVFWIVVRDFAYAYKCLCLGDSYFRRVFVNWELLMLSVRLGNLLVIGVCSFVGGS